MSSPAAHDRNMSARNVSQISKVGLSFPWAPSLDPTNHEGRKEVARDTRGNCFTPARSRHRYNVVLVASVQSGFAQVTVAMVQNMGKVAV